MGFLCQFVVSLPAKAAANCGNFLPPERRDTNEEVSSSIFKRLYSLIELEPEMIAIIVTLLKVIQMAGNHQEVLLSKPHYCRRVGCIKAALQINS